MDGAHTAAMKDQFTPSRQTPSSQGKVNWHQLFPAATQTAGILTLDRTDGMTMAAY
jgi:hypothetical protein